MDEDLALMKTDIELIKKDISYIKKQISEITKSINGNGSPGVIQRLERLETFRDKTSGALFAMNIIWGIVVVILSFLIQG